MPTAQELLSRGCINVFRRLSMKRVQRDGTYEADWYDITYYVARWPYISKGFGDEVTLGEYEIESFELELDNSSRKFNRPTSDNYESLFYGYASQKWTKYKIEIGFLDDDDAEVAGLVFYGILHGDPENTDEGIIRFPISGLLKVFEFYSVSGIASTAATTATLIDRIYNKTQNATSIFSRYFAGSSINPDAVSCMTVSVPEIYASQTCWEKIIDYSIYQDFFPSIDNSGNFVWRGRDATATEQWKLNGAGSIDSNDYGINIISISERDGLNNFWPRVSIEYEDNTFSTATTNWTPGDLSDTDIYGERTYSSQMLELSSGEATTVSERIRDAYNAIKKEWTIRTVFLPLEIRDKVEINYIGEYSEPRPFILDYSALGGSDTLGQYLNSININAVTAKIIRIGFDLENIECNMIVREV